MNRSIVSVDVLGAGSKDWCETKAARLVGQQFEARRAFGDLLGRYDLRSADGRTLVSAAAELLVAGIDGPAVIELASEVVAPLTSPFEMDALVGSAREELGMPMLDSDGTSVRAALGQLRRWRSGLLTDRELARWAHDATVTTPRSDCDQIPRLPRPVGSRVTARPLMAGRRE